MLRSPTHLVGHGPTSHTATSSPNGGGNSHHHNGIGSPLHRSHHTNGMSSTPKTTTTTTNRTTNGFKNGFLLNGGAISGKSSQHNNNNNHTSNNNNSHHMTSPAASANSSASSLMTTGGGSHHGGSSTTTTTTTQTTTRTSLFDSCHRKIRLIGGGPVAFLGGLVAKARRKERDGDQNASDTKLYLEESVLERKLPEADLKALVDLPAGLDYNEWLASHTLALFEHVNLVYGTISEFCTPSGCPDMTGPGNRTYLWFDEKGKKTRVAAPQYIDYVMTFTQKTVSDELIFPTKYANEFPNSFESIARKILRLQFHVIAHLYAAHFREIALLGLHTHLNLTFAHLTALHRRFNLIDEKETDVLRDLEVALRLTDDGSNSSETASIQTGSSSMSTTMPAALSSSSAASNAATTASAHHTGAAVTTMTGTVTGASEDVNLLQSGRRIDGDAMAQPICTQPEAKRSLNSEQSDIRGGAGGGVGGGGGGGGGGLMGGILGDFNTSEFGDMRTGGGTSGYCIGGVSGSTAKSSHIGYNNNHHNGSTHNMLQCNSSSNKSSNNSPTPQQHHHTSHTTTA